MENIFNHSVEIMIYLVAIFDLWMLRVLYKLAYKAYRDRKTPYARERRILDQYKIDQAIIASRHAEDVARRTKVS